MKRILVAIGAAGLLAACSAPPDEAWIRITEVRTSGEEALSVTVVNADLRDSSTDTVDLVVENGTVIVGSGGDSGVGIQVYRARVEYRLGAYDLPRYEYPVTLYLPPPGAEDVTGTGEINGLPVAPATLKGWLLNPDNFPPELLRQPVRIEVKITLHARTDEGRELDTSAGLSLELVSVPPPEVEESPDGI